MPYQIFHAVCVERRAPRIPPSAHPELAALLLRCLAWDREARPTAGDAVEELLQIQVRSLSCSSFL